MLKILLPPFLAAVLAVSAAIILNTHTCDVSGFDSGQATGHARYLASPELEGRAAGTGGNRLAVEYLESEMAEIGLLPAPGSVDYRQTFQTVTPQIDTSPVFSVDDGSGRTAMVFEMYTDYRLLPSGRSRGIDYRGDLVLAGHNLARLTREDLEGKIVLVESILATEKKINMARDMGCEGVIFAASKDWSMGRRQADQSIKLLDSSGKTGADIMVATIGIDGYRQLIALAGETDLFSRSRPSAVIPGVRFKASMDFPAEEVSSLVGFIPGKDQDRTLILSANIDGLGSSAGNRYFPGAANSAASAGVLLETARTLSMEGSRPARNIAFVFWNAGVQGSAGMEHYLTDPAFPLPGTSLIHLDTLGSSEDFHVSLLASEGGAGEVLRDKLIRFAGDRGIPAGGTYRTGTEPVLPFIRAGVPSVSFSTADPRPDDYRDSPEVLTSSDLEPAAEILLQYIKRDIYRDVAIDYLTPGWRWMLGIILVLVLAAWLLSSSYRADPNGRFLGISTETLFYHPASEIIRKATAFILTFGTAFFLIVLVVNLPRNGTFIRTDTEVFTNQSIYLSVKETLATIADFVSFENTGPARRADLAEALIPAWWRTLALSAVAMILSLTVGSLAGIREAFGSRKLSGIRTAGSLFVASLPDVAVALAGIWLFLAVAKISPELSAGLALKQFTIPAAALALLPGSYVARITSVTVRRELDRDYIILAAAKGLTRRQILIHELKPAILTGIFDTIPAMAAIMLTNLIIIEFMFDYKGIVNYLLLFHTRGDAGAFVTGALAAGAIYGIYAAAGRLLSLAVSPGRRNRR